MAQAKSPDDRWAWVEVDLNAIRKNTRAFKDRLEPGVKMMCAVKADAYGHGAVPCTKAMHSAGADQFAVATVQEGVELREAGITWPILMLNESPIESIDTLLEYDIMPAVYTSDFALAYGERAVALGKVGKYHLAIDTGMSRIGVMPEDAVEFRHAIDFHRGLECAGTFTHFATAENLHDWDFQLQSKRFSDTVRALQDAGYDCGLVHCDNTPGTILHPECHFDMCRVGIGLYGLQPADTTESLIDLVPAMSVRARAIRVAEPAVGEGVGYGMTYRIAKPGIQIVTVPLGYADGVARELSNRMDVLVNGQCAHQVGNICMDQLMFAYDTKPATRRGTAEVNPVRYGDVVTIMGADGGEEITADEIARLRGTINYEITCDFSLRLERIYV